MRLFPALALLVTALTLSACYHPLYGDKPLGAEATPQQQKLNNVFIGAIDGENGQKLRNNLIDRMYGEGRPVKAAYRLDVKLNVGEEHLGLQKNAVTTRVRLDVSATYTLVDTSTNKGVFSATTRSVVDYNILAEEYATLTERENAFDRALREVSDLMVNRLLLYFDERK